MLSCRSTSSLASPDPMYVNTAVRFRDPFVSSKDCPPALHGYVQARDGWTTHSHAQDINRALTPPPEMSGVHSSTRPSFHAGEYGQQHIPAYRAPYPLSEAPSDSHRNGVMAAYHNVRTSPAKQAPIEPLIDPSQSRRGSQYHNAIATNFQIPRSVNDSGGSLSELAAQITCLFWFESSDLLQQVEDSPTLLPNSRPLVTDAKPTTGFRKWVTTILSTTCVAQNVVILALLFVYRLKKLNPSVRGKPGSEYRLLTVALMLGNKFLDDNTYTNKTWAEVSGINVAEVHIMEVEFLSNMKYCLFTSEKDWAQWQSLLGKFASFFDQASRPVPARAQLAPILPPASSLHLPHALPSPPVSNQASPPYYTEIGQSSLQYVNGQLGPTPAPSPLGNIDVRSGQAAGVKRALDESTTEPPSKRLAGNYNYISPNRYSTMPVQQNLGHSVPRLTLPSLGVSGPQAAANTGYVQATHAQQLPPLSVPARAMGMAHPVSSSQTHSSTTAASAVAIPQYAPPHSQQPSRHHSPHQGGSQHEGSAVVSPTNGLPQSATALHPPAQISPTYFLQQRASPYRPVHHVSTLLYPPPSGATQARQSNIELNQMQYQPLGKPTHHTGRLPYVGQNLWIDGSHPQEMTPVHRWPNFPQQSLAPQH